MRLVLKAHAPLQKFGEILIRHAKSRIQRHDDDEICGRTYICCRRLWIHVHACVLPVPCRERVVVCVYYLCVCIADLLQICAIVIHNSFRCKRCIIFFVMHDVTNTMFGVCWTLHRFFAGWSHRRQSLNPYAGGNFATSYPWTIFSKPKILLAECSLSTISVSQGRQMANSRISWSGKIPVIGVRITISWISLDYWNQNQKIKWQNGRPCQYGSAQE